MSFLLHLLRFWLSLTWILLIYTPLRLFGFPSATVPLLFRSQGPRHRRIPLVTPYSTIPNEPAVTIEKATQRFTHQDIRWILRPCEDPSRRQIWQWRFWGCLNRLQYLLRVIPELPPFPIQPRKPSCDEAPPSRIVLYAYHCGTPIGRFGIVPDAGGSVPPDAMQLAAERLKIPSAEIRVLRTAAIIYMFAEPEYRNRSVGSLALAVISHVHASRGCHCTVLVANDAQARQEASENSKVDMSQVDERLVQWYERHGYIRTPELQELLGSPQGVYGITMMAPTQRQAAPPFRIHWW